MNTVKSYFQPEKKAEAFNEKNLNIIEILAQNYACLFYINLKEKNSEVISVSREVSAEVQAILSETEIFGPAFNIFVKKYVHPDDVSSLENLSSFEGVYNCLRFRKRHAIACRINYTGEYLYFKVTFAKAEAAEEEPVNVALTFSDIDEIYRDKLNRSRESAIISELSADFDYVGYVALNEDKSEDICVDYRANTKLTSLVPGWFEEKYFHNRLDLIIKHLGKDLDTDDFFMKTRREVIINRLENAPAYFINARASVEGAHFNYQIKFTADRNAGGEMVGFVVGIRNIDTEIQDEIESKTGTFENMRILLVDDDDLSREINEDILVSQNAVITTADCGEDAVKYASTRYFDLVLLDMIMPGMNGLDAVGEIRRLDDGLKADVPVIILTADTSETNIALCKAAGADDCMTKPLIVSELSNKFMSLIKNKAIRVEKALEDTMQMAKTDALTKVKNLTAYTQKVDELNKTIKIKNNSAFGIVICDINDLKKENDNRGHDIGDIYIKNCCSLICRVFSHSPVYRIGGDEFAVILQGQDFNNREKLMEFLRKEILTAMKYEKAEEGKASLAAGISIFDNERDKAVSDVFKRADESMYRNKSLMKKSAS